MPLSATPRLWFPQLNILKEIPLGFQSRSKCHQVLVLGIHFHPIQPQGAELGPGADDGSGQALVIQAKPN